VIDEVDDVLPPHDPEAPGNRLISEMYKFAKYQAPIQLVFNSATLAGSTVNHVRRFLKKGLLASRTSRIFESPTATGTPSLRSQGVPSRVTVPVNIDHTFFTADTLSETAEVFQRALRLGLNGEQQCLRGIVILSDTLDVRQFVEHVIIPMGRSAPETVDGSSALEGRPWYAKEEGPVAIAGDPGNGELLLCPVRAVRGLDVPGLTHCIVLAEPTSSSEYAHWCGRVGRLGQQGQSAVIMSRRFTRRMSDFCETLGIPFRLQRRHSELTVLPTMIE
jgi:hypothetical protein